jgi:hypothetical protein
MFDNLARSQNHQQRGYLLQDLLNRIFDLYQIPVVKSFTRNEGAEQIDGRPLWQAEHGIISPY